jgi:two-component system, OmpR family, response regulator
MSAATVIFAREDLSIPGAAALMRNDAPVDAESHFFNLLRDSNPDAVVLDLSRSPAKGIETILKIRQRNPVPILVVCDPQDAAAQEFRFAGAADCIPTPIDVLVLNRALQQIIKVTRSHRQQSGSAAGAFAFAGFTFYPRRDLLAVASGATLGLTSSESRLLLHFVSYPWRLCPRAEIAGALYGEDRVVGDRAIDIIVNRLRRKLGALRGVAAGKLIKTEFRRGYMLVASVSTLTENDSEGVPA